RVIFLITLVSLFLASCRGSKSTTSTKNTENTASNSLKEKYVPLLGVEKKELDNVALLKFIDEWYGTPYKYGGKDKKGIDCSSFSCQLLKNVFGKTIAGSAQGLYDQCKTEKVAKLKEGDLVFFKIESSKVSHVGVYLMNNKFVHATTKKGVMINDLNETYYKKYFYAGGKLN
ncbi:MAG: C40 family peptidase, partial [Bacteroidia bacterium]|nr:C40 family peptidase [Bacteroidia bacterium]